jgi:DMSO/TMAO reductase YedYZ heme-binding membrane subunit
MLAGWPIVGWAFIALSAMVLLTLALFGLTEDGVHAVIRYTARTSLVLFGAAFTASSLRILWPTPATRWLLVNRRYLGVSFAVSHAMHMTAIIALAQISSAFRADVNMVTVAFGGFGFVVAGALAATSSNRAVAALGARRWRALHKFGVYYLWFIFFVTYLPAASKYPSYITFVVFLLALLSLRLWAARRA